MNSQDFRNLQEAYLEVAMGEGKVPWNDPNRPLQSGHTPAEKNRAKRARTGVEDPNKSQMDISDRSMSRYGGMKTADDTETSKAPKQKKTLFGKPKPLEHETPPHEFKKNRKLDLKQTGNEYSMNKQSFGKGNATIGQARRAVGASFAGSRDGDSSIFPTPIQQGDPRRRTSKKWGGPNPRTRKENVDLYDVILEYLLDEGYADTQEAALAIMGNMSEEWKDTIVEEVLDEAYVDYRKGKLPSGRTPQQAAQGRSELLNAREKMDKSILGKPGAFERQSNQNTRTKEMDKLTASNPVSRAVRRGLGDMLPGGQPSTDRHSNAMDRRNRVADLASAEKKSRGKFQ
jgi:hypothetical protein